MLEGKWQDLPDQAKQIWLWGTDDTLEFTWRGGGAAVASGKLQHVGDPWKTVA